MAALCIAARAVFEEKFGNSYCLAIALSAITEAGVDVPFMLDTYGFLTSLASVFLRLIPRLIVRKKDLRLAFRTGNVIFFGLILSSL